MLISSKVYVSHLESKYAKEQTVNVIYLGSTN